MTEKKETAQNGVPLEELDLLGLPYDMLLDRAAILEGETPEMFSERVFQAQLAAQAAEGDRHRLAKEKAALATAVKQIEEQFKKDFRTVNLAARIARAEELARGEVQTQMGRKLGGIRIEHSTPAKQDLSARERKIWKVIQLGVRGPTYCRELHNAKLKPPKRWTDRGCPSTYPKAYLQGFPWNKRIQDEKHRIQKKAELA